MKNLIKSTNKNNAINNIAVVLPSTRKELYNDVFLPQWDDLFKKHNVTLLTVWDEKDPLKTTLEINNQEKINIKDILGENSDLVSNKNAGVRSLGIAHIGLNMPEIEYIVSLDDDLAPIGDPIQDHINALSMRVPISWMLIGNAYTRGFPYQIREEAEVVLSHGVWEGIPDFDAPTQLVNGAFPMDFYKMPIPKGVLAPISYMNTAFKRKLIPYIFMCPQIKGVLERCDDIWCSIEAKRAIDKFGWAMVTGFSRVYHKRASDVFSSLIKESKFIQLNEGYWKGEQRDPYFKMYHKRRKRWENLAWR